MKKKLESISGMYSQHEKNHQVWNGPNILREKYRLASLRKTIPIGVEEVIGKSVLFSMLRVLNDILGF